MHNYKYINDLYVVSPTKNVHYTVQCGYILTLPSGIPPQVVMKWTGHADYKAMRPYIDIAEKTKADAMKLIDNAWGM